MSIFLLSSTLLHYPQVASATSTTTHHTDAPARAGFLLEIMTYQCLPVHTHSKQYTGARRGCYQQATHELPSYEVTPLRNHRLGALWFRTRPPTPYQAEVHPSPSRTPCWGSEIQLQQVGARPSWRSYQQSAMFRRQCWGQRAGCQRIDGPLLQCSLRAR